MDQNLSPIACCWCFKNRGLILDAMQCGRKEEGACPNCGRTDGIKLGMAPLRFLVHRFFVDGSFHRTEYGGASVVQINSHQKTTIRGDEKLNEDIGLLERLLGVGFFHYGPRLWMVGQNDQLLALESRDKRGAVVRRIISEYPARVVATSETFYRVRKDPGRPQDQSEYDSPPTTVQQGRRFGGPVLYASPLIDLCIHECRYTAEDDLYVAALNPARPLNLLDLTHLLREDSVNEFTSLDIALNFLFLAGEHAYPITRDIAGAAKSAGFDGIVYPSYFSLLMSGHMPYRTSYGISHRVVEQLQDAEESMSLPNIAIFGRPLEDGIVSVDSINRLLIRRVDYEFHFGPLVD